ncbi:hypothetical protein BGZ99_001378, partial [Dissophora globulifera]
NSSRSSFHGGVRDSSPSSDYGSGTGSSLPGSVPISRSGSFCEDNKKVLEGHGGVEDQQQPRPRLRSRRRSHHQEEKSQQQGMIPVSTMRTFRRLSMKRGNDSAADEESSTPTDRVEPDVAGQPGEHVQGDQCQYEIHTGERSNSEDEEKNGSIELKTGNRAR